MNQTKQERINTVNVIIKEIASLGRKFFEHKGDISFLELKNNEVYMFGEYSKTFFSLHTKNEYPPKDFTMGGTIWALTRDFKDFILTGEKSNHNHGYGGLYCSHWGYSEADMKRIQELAVQLGYL